MRLWMMAAAMFLAVPAAAQTDDAALVGAVRQFADMTAGARAPVDQLLYFGRDPSGEVVVTSMMALAPGSAWPPPPANDHPPIAAMRCSGSSPDHNRRPDPADFAYARTAGVPVFIVGTWAHPAIVWEVVWQDGQGRMRVIDRQGRAGPCQIPAS